MSCNNDSIDALPKGLYWTIRPGSSSFDFTFRLLEGSTAIDITGYDFEVVFRRPNGTELLSLGLGDGITFVSSTQGRASLSTADSATLPQDLDITYEFRTTTPTLEEYPLLGGILMVTARTTACVQVPESTDFTVSMTAANLDFVFSQSLPGSYFTELAVEDGDTYTIPAGKMLLAMAIDPADADRIISVGYAADGTEVLDNEEIPADESYLSSRPLYFFNSQIIHFSGDSATIKLYIF